MPRNPPVGPLLELTLSVAPSIPLLEISLDDTRLELEKETFTAVELVHAYTKRIQEVDHVFRPVLEVNPEAALIAQQLDEEAKTSGRRGCALMVPDQRLVLNCQSRPLHGVTIMLKDNIVTLARMKATAGTVTLLGVKPAHESTVASKLREAGAVILGNVTLTEWANYR